MTDQEYIEENDDDIDPDEWTPRESADFIKLSEITPEDRITTDSFKPSKKFENIEKIQFRCQPIDKDPAHISLDSLTKNSPIKEIMYRLLVNHKRSMKLADIVEKTRNIIKDRKLSTHALDGNEYMGFYNVMKKDTHYGFEEIE